MAGTSRVPSSSSTAVSSWQPALIICCLALAGHRARTASAQTLSVCTRCPGKAASAAVLGFCHSAPARRLSARCCLTVGDAHDTILGLDLSGCLITAVEGLLDNATKAEVIDLSENPFANISSETFRGFTSLEYIELPRAVECPGGNKAWERIYGNHSRICQDQRNACNESSNHCPKEALCHPDGPGFYMCDCKDTHHGYKCIREGFFPMALVFGLLTAVTFLVSAFLWATQRRKAKIL